MTTTSIQETRQTAMQPATNFLITTPVTEQTYYALYVHNPQVSCICALFNRIIYFLFSWMECCLGKASDQSKKISMQNEITLIRNFTTAEKELLSALRAAENSQGQEAQQGAQQETQQGTQKEEENYFKALKARQEQINSFTFSQEALAQGCQQVDLVGAAQLRLQQQLNGTPMPASLMNMPSQVEPEPSSTSSGLEQLQSGQEIEQPFITPSSSQSNPSLSKNSRAKILNEKRKIVTDKLLKTPDFNSVDKSDIQGYSEAFKAYHAFMSNSREDFTLFYRELSVLRSELNKLEDDGRLLLILQFAKQFGLLKSDPRFVDTYATQTRIYYIDCYFRFPTVLSPIGGAFAVLRSYFDEIVRIYFSAHEHAPEVDSATYAKKQVAMLLSEVHKNYANQYVGLSKSGQSARENELYKLAQHLHCFAADAQSDAQAKGAQFIEDVLKGKVAGTTKTTVQDSQSSASQSTSPSQSSVASSSLSSSTSTVRSTTTSSLDTQPVKAVEANNAQLFSKARDVLITSFGEVQTVDRIPPVIFQTYVAELKNYCKNFGYEFSKPLTELELRCYDVGVGTNFQHKRLSPNEILTLKVRVAKELDIANTQFLEEAIAAMFNEAVTGLSACFLPGAIQTRYASGKRPLIFQNFYTTIISLSTLIQPKSNHTEYAKDQLKKLFIEMSKNSINVDSYNEFAYVHRAKTDKTIITELLIKIADALPGFKSSASKKEQEQAEDLLTSIITSTGS